MARIVLPEAAVQQAKRYSEETRDALLNNVTIMDNNINSQFAGLQDPTFQSYLQLSEQLQTSIKQVGVKLDEISQYCQEVINWINKF